MDGRLGLRAQASWLYEGSLRIFVLLLIVAKATAMQGLIALNMPTYSWDGWIGTLLVIGIVVFSVLFNTVLASRLPFIEGILLILHVAGLLAVIIPLWIMAPRANARYVFLDFQDNGNWGNTGISTMIGLPTMIAMLYVSLDEEF